MRLRYAIAITALVGLIVALVVFSNRNDETHVDAMPLTESASSSAESDVSRGSIADDDAPEFLHFEPDRESNRTMPDPDSETPPRTVAGLPAVRKAIELPIVDPKTLPFDPNVGRVDVDTSQSQAARGPGFVVDPAIDPMNAPDDRIIETDGGPLAGMIPTPDPTAPGPLARLPAADSPPVLDDPVSIHAVDPNGPGMPVDPGAAAAAPPNYVLPGEGVAVSDPDPGAAEN